VGWRLVMGRIVEAIEPIKIGGLDLWKHRWKSLDDPPITVAHPQYPHQRHVMQIFEIRDGDVVVRFAAGEFSNGAWGIYLPE
jgi:hypothetical protein